MDKRFPLFCESFCFVAIIIRNRHLKRRLIEGNSNSKLIKLTSHTDTLIIMSQHSRYNEICLYKLLFIVFCTRVLLREKKVNCRSTTLAMHTFVWPHIISYFIYLKPKNNDKSKSPFCVSMRLLFI